MVVINSLRDLWPLVQLVPIKDVYIQSLSGVWEVDTHGCTQGCTHGCSFKSYVLSIIWLHTWLYTWIYTDTHMVVHMEIHTWLYTWGSLGTTFCSDLSKLDIPWWYMLVVFFILHYALLLCFTDVILMLYDSLFHADLCLATLFHWCTHHGAQMELIFLAATADMGLQDICLLPWCSTDGCLYLI